MRTRAITAGTLGVPEFFTHVTEPIDADVRKPKGLKAKGLVVKSSNPAPGATKPAFAKVHLRLGPKSR